MDELAIRRNSKVIYLAGLFIIIWIGIEAGVVFLVTDYQQKRLFADLSAPILDLLASAAILIALKKSSSLSKRIVIAWLFIGLAYLLFTIGDVSWAILELGLKVEPYPSIADVFYLAYYPILFIGIFLIPRKSGNILTYLKEILDISIILMASILGLWYFLIGPTFQTNLGEPLLNQSILFAYSIGDVVLLGALLRIAFGNYSEQLWTPLTYLAGSLLVTVVTDIIYSYQTLQGFYASGGLLDIGWDISTLLLFMAGISLLYSNKPRDDSGKVASFYRFLNKFKWVITFSPYLFLIGAYILLLMGDSNSNTLNSQTISIYVGAVILLVLVRQIITLKENISLNEKLLKTNEDLQVEISEHSKVVQQLSFDNLHDGLTGLANRILFKDRLIQIMEYARRYSIYSCAVLFIDLDRFKIINDSLGHMVGDQILVMVAQRLTNCLRLGDTISRLGGDEFVVLLNKTDDTSSVLVAVHKIMDALHSPYNLDGRELYVTASIGIVPNLTGYDNAEEILRDADIAMYSAKADGKDCYKIFDVSMLAEANSRLLVESDIRKGLEKGEFHLYYQPILDLKTKKLTGFESLIRWIHPEKGILLPKDFLDIAEESGLIVPLGEWIINRACTQMKAWQDQYPSMEGLSISVNISSKQFAHPSFESLVVDALNKSGLDAAALKLEITEKVLINDYTSAKRIFAVFQELGVHIQLDDFGTGYSAMGYLQRYPINAIKIDRSFIHEMDKDFKNSELVRAIIAMAHALGVFVIAEGIEKENELNELKKLLCDSGQGFLISRPVDSVMAEKILASQVDEIQFPYKI